MPREAANPPWHWPARRGAALLWAFPARRHEDLRGALGVGGGGRARAPESPAGGMELLVWVIACCASDLFVAPRRLQVPG